MSSTAQSTPVVSDSIKAEVAALKADVMAELKAVALDKPQATVNVQPRSKGATAILSADKYARILAAHDLTGWQLAWVRPGYAMFKTGNKGQWLTVCTHGTVQFVTKGALAETAGRKRAQWCTSCKSA